MNPSRILEFLSLCYLKNTWPLISILLSTPEQLLFARPYGVLPNISEVKLSVKAFLLHPICRFLVYPSTFLHPPADLSPLDLCTSAALKPLAMIQHLPSQLSKMAPLIGFHHPALHWGKDSSGEHLDTAFYHRISNKWKHLLCEVCPT